MLALQWQVNNDESAVGESSVDNNGVFIDFTCTSIKSTTTKTKATTTPYDNEINNSQSKTIYVIK
jgi:hypothetical protein